MGSLIEKKNVRSLKNNSNFVQRPKSKGDRLGWSSLKDEQVRPLREIIGEGRQVDPFCFMTVSRKTIL